MKKNFEKIELGKSYKDGHGDVIKIVNFFEKGPLQYKGDNGRYYTVYGIYFGVDNCGFKDLIFELIKEDPNPTIRTFPSGAIRSSDKGRPRPDWISAWALEALGQHLADNAALFEGNGDGENYLLGIPPNECLASLMRHYVTYKKNPNKKDAVSILFNAVALVHSICLEDEKSK
jgi:hypothetical protein